MDRGSAGARVRRRRGAVVARTSRHRRRLRGERRRLVTRRLAFASARHDTWDIDWAIDLFVADAAGGAPLRITQTGPAYALPAWSPDGSRIACTRAPSEIDGPWNGQIAILDADGGNEIVL